MSLPWRWFGTDAEEPDWIGDVRQALTPISDALPEIDKQQARWPIPDSEDQPDPCASRRHWLLEQPELQLARDGLERLGFDVVGEPLPVRERDGIVRATPIAKIRSLGARRRRQAGRRTSSHRSR